MRSMRDFVDDIFDKYEIIDRDDQWSPSYVGDRDNFLSSLIGSTVSSVGRWKFYILRVERRLRYNQAQHQPFKKFSGEELVTQLALRSTLISLRLAQPSELFTKTALIDVASKSTLVSTGTARTWVESLLQKKVLKELSHPSVTVDKRIKYLYASDSTRVEFYKDCVIEMLSHIRGVSELFGLNSVQFAKEVDLFAAYEIISQEKILEIISEHLHVK